METSKFLDTFTSEEELINTILHTSSAVWKNELVIKDIHNWLDNFSGEVFDKLVERRLALWLLANFTFYNEDEIRYLCKVIYWDFLHLILKITGGDPETTVKEFFQHTKIISPEKNSGSGGFISYYFRHENQLPMTLFDFSLKNIGANIKNVMVIDDVTLTAGEGGQMDPFWKDAIANFSDKTYYLLTLIASEEACDYLEKTYGIKIITAIKLDQRDKCFEAKSDVFAHLLDQFPSLSDDTKAFAYHYGEKIRIPDVDPLGHANGQYTFGFFYNTPDNTLPIFWGAINGWAPVLRRYHKNYKERVFLHNERFI